MPRKDTFHPKRKKPTGTEAAGSAAANAGPEVVEGRGRAGKHVNNKKLDRKSHYEAQDLYRAYWGVRSTSRILFEQASQEYCEELLDYHWHYFLGPYKPPAEDEVPVEVEVEVEVTEGAGSAAPVSEEVVTWREFCGVENST